MRKLFLLAIVLFYSCHSSKKEDKQPLKKQPRKEKVVYIEAPYFKAVKNNDVALGKPTAGQWLDMHKEKGQSFEQFMNSKHIVPTKDSNIIYVKPIGNFTDLQKKQIKLLREYLAIFFQLETKIAEKASNDIIPNNARRISTEGHEQFLAGYILDDILKEEKPEKRIALMGLTEVDLYPKPEWNYVFGLASYSQKIGVSSIYRLQDGKLTEENFNLCLSRLLKICSHEIGHMFGLHHCVEVNCAMNGTNSLVETDTKVIRLCSVCQRKLNSGINYDNNKRLTELAAFFQRNNLKDELQLMEKDLKSIQ
ncbi:archaemetzincin [Flavobacterium sp. 270]|uniref:Zn-dependent protease n=1 Tax=Flavobacterium sp. 270 TaxID=2512114 RepID=UPI0010655321|nr:Zn-dependent protease [Flavobacterium sp. 270]TDW52631.1 archaemetzincin [Flavobacterium sp. 270]